MIRKFENKLDLTNYVILYRALDNDPSFEIVGRTTELIPSDGATSFIIVESVLSSNAIAAGLSQPPTQEEISAYQAFVNARINAKAIPNWATWSENEALEWADTNIGTPLSTGRANLPAQLSLATTRMVFLALFDILDQFYIALVAIIRMVIALRNKVF